MKIDNPVINDLTPLDLPRIAWAGSPAHIRNVAKELERVEKGEAEYLALRDPQGDPIAIGLIDHAFSGDGSEIGQLSTRQDLQSRGNGTMLIAAAEERIRQFGHEWSVMGVEPENDRARRLYERLGYRAYNRTTDCWTAEDGEGIEFIRTAEIILLRKQVFVTRNHAP